MSLKKYIPSSTVTVQIVLVVAVLGALGVIGFGQSWIKTHILGRM